MLPLGLFRRRAFTGVQLAAFAVSGSLFALFLYLTLYLQNYLGLSPLEAGVRYLPITIASFVAAPIAGAMLSRVPARLMMSTSLALGGVGLLLMSGIEAGDEWTTLLGGFLVAGAGVGLLNPVIADVAVSVVPRAQSGMAAGINDTFRQVGVAVGIAVWGAIFVGRGADKVAELTAGTPAATGGRPRELVEAASSGNLDHALAAVPPGARQTLSNAAGEGFLTGLNDVLVLGALLCFAGAVLALWLVRESEIEREPLDSERVPEADRMPEAAAA
jgi:Major Facilitator Superfamily